MNRSVEILSKLDEFLEGEVSLSELDEWLAPRLPYYLDAPDSLNGRLAGAIELFVAESQSGLSTTRRARQSLRRYKAMQTLVWYRASDAEETTSTATAEVPGVSLFQPLIWSSAPQGVA